MVQCVQLYDFCNICYFTIFKSKDKLINLGIRTHCLEKCTFILRKQHVIFHLLKFTAFI